MTISAGQYGTIYATLSLTLAAGDTRRVPGLSSYFAVLNATDKDQIAVSFDGAAFFPIPPGIALSFPESDIWVQNTDGSINTVVVAYGSAQLRDNRMIIDSLNPLVTSITGSVSTENLQHAGLRTSGETGWMVATATVSILAATAAGKHHVLSSLTLTNQHATVGTVVTIAGLESGDLNIFVPALGTVHLSFPNEGLEGATATALTATNVTTGSNVNVHATAWTETE
jgi:hypothetical protein